MFALHTANRTELLFQQLCTVLDHYDHGPFDPVRFLIQGRGMERWLQMRLAQSLGVFALGRFDFPHRFFATLAAGLGLRLSDADFERSRLTWLIDELLGQPELRSDPALRRYLDGPGPQLRRFQLARQLAHLFDQYQIQRRDWLAHWQEGKTVPGLADDAARWQASLWRRLYRRLGGHRGELWEALIHRLERPVPRELLPPAVHVFGVGFLPPLMVEVLAALARHADVHLYLLAPVAGYWADLPGKRRRALAIVREGPETPLAAMHHPLLVALGQRGAQFQRLVLACLEPALESECFHRHHPPATLLQHLQNDLAAGVLSVPDRELEVGIELHRCHTPLREVEVARDRILALLAGDATLQLEDIAVMAPDIGDYQPYLDAVFADLPHHVADRTLERSNPLLEVLIEALELLAGRFEWDAVLELLGRPAVRERFGLSATQLPQLERWVRDCAIRWGLDGEQRQALGLPNSEHNSWRLGVDRMILGWLAASEEDWQGLVPFGEVEGQAGRALLRLADFLRVLQHWWRRWQQPAVPEKWCEDLIAFAAELFASTPETLAAMQALEELLETLPPAEDYSLEVTLELMVDWLRSRVEEVVSDDFLSGGITCCTLLPMRAVPFRVIVVLGLNDGAFPKRETPPAFDLLAAHPRLGDRDRRLDQRHQFLELLLSVRERLILTCQGLTPEKNEKLPPAQVVNELADTLARYGVEGQNWIFDHPSHPFHPGYFRAESPWSCHDPDRFPVARALLASGSRWRFWPEDFTLSGDPPEVVEFPELLSFYADAQGWFCRQRLQMAQLAREVLPEAREPFDVDGLLAWRMRRCILEALRQEQDPQRLLRQAQRTGDWPQGEMGRQRFEILLAQCRRLFDAAGHCGAGRCLEGLWCEIDLGGVSLRGRLEPRYENGLLLVEPAIPKGKHLFRAWLLHLLAQSQRPAPTWLVTLAEKDREEVVAVWYFQPLPDWRQLLALWVGHFLDSWNRPSPWLAEWGWCLWQLQDQVETEEDLLRRWCRAYPDLPVTEGFTLLWGEVEEGFPARVLPLYRRLVGVIPKCSPAS